MNWGLSNLTDPLSEKRPFSMRETMKRCQRNNESQSEN